MDVQARLRREGQAIVATAVSFVAAAVVAVPVLQGAPRPLSGVASLSTPAAVIAGMTAALAFAVSAVRHHRGETAAMPRWQATVSNVSAVALALAIGAVTGYAVLLAGAVLVTGFRGLELSPLGGALLVGAAAAAGGRAGFLAGVGLRTRDLSVLLFAFLAIGTLFAMLTASDPRWWERNFSQLGIGPGGWAFNGTLVVAGLLVATVGSYVGRDLHRLCGDPDIGRIGRTVVLWALAGAALAGTGITPLPAEIATASAVDPPSVGSATDVRTIVHLAFALAALVLFAAATVQTVRVLPRRPRFLGVTLGGLLAVLAAGILLWWPVGFATATVFEGIAVGLGLLGMTTIVRVLAILAPETSRVSARSHLRLIPRVRRAPSGRSAHRAQ
ncbi:DUF998 domain-containing protein [Streptomyces sp. MS2A]|nr:DUF998 domain-containing protein [Streptomyces sp. MS2A]